jgi:hypothetical protein
VTKGNKTLFLGFAKQAKFCETIDKFCHVLQNKLKKIAKMETLNCHSQTAILNHELFPLRPRKCFPYTTGIMSFWESEHQFLFKGTVSRDFSTLFLIPLDRFEGRNRAGSGLLFILMMFSCLNFKKLCLCGKDPSE